MGLDTYHRRGTMSSMRTQEQVLKIYWQLESLRNNCTLLYPAVYVVRIGASTVISISEADVRRIERAEGLDSGLYGIVSMNDTDQILADLAEVL